VSRWRVGTGARGQRGTCSTFGLPLARVGNKNAPGGHGGYMQTDDTYAVSYRRGPAGIHACSSRSVEYAEGGIC